MVVDLIIIAIVALSTFLAYKKGLVNLAIGLCAFVVSIVITVILYQPISNLVIHTTSIDEMIEDAIYEKANEMMTKDENDNDNDNDLTNDLVEIAKNEMLPETARTLAVNIVTGGVILILFVGVKIALRFVSAFANAVAKLPILDQINKAGGLVYGLLRGILMIYIVLVILHIPAQINPNNVIHENIEKSYLGKSMYENNILNVFF